MKTRMSFLFCALLIVIPPLPGTAAGEAASAPRSIVLMIADGMGPAQLTALKTTQSTLHMERLKTGGLVTTHAADAFVTDSAAAGTALASGHKTNNRRVGQDPDGAPLPTVLEIAAKRGKGTGIVAACSLTHATPAAFLAHVPSRYDDLAIAAQIAGSPADVLIGGGLAYFVPRGHPVSERKDDLDLVAAMRETKPVVESLEALRVLDNPKAFAALLSPKHIPRAAERDYSLAVLTRHALDALAQHPNGFFLMVEGSQIDWAGHQNDLPYLLEEMEDFDEAVGVVMEFAATHPDVLVVVTSDHETGGLVLEDGSVEERTLTDVEFESKAHSACMVPLLAHGPGAAAFGGILDNTDIGRLLIRFVSE